jgi:hypothetical protein
MREKIKNRCVCTTVGVVVTLIIALHAVAVLAEVPEPQINPPYIVDSFVDDEGRQIDKIIVPGRPPEIKAAVAMVPEPNIALGINNLGNVPAFDWSYGCSATSGSMMAGYYDRTGYPNMYIGPTNGGVCPMDNSVWGSGIGGSDGECPLSATHNGFDGRTTRGHVDDYWVGYGSTAQDPFITNGWDEHIYGDCTGDYMKTNQCNYGNIDGSTTFWLYDSGAPLYDSQMEGYEIDDEDGGYGLKLFFESRGYVVTEMYNQRIQGQGTNPTLGFTFDDYKAEIDAGRPVIIQVEGHSMLGYGYDDSSNLIYLHNTWDYGDHAMPWGGSYYGMQHYAVTVIQLKQLPVIASCDSGGTEKTFFQPGDSISVEGGQFDPDTTYKIWIQDNPVSEGDSLAPGEDDSGLLELEGTDGSGNLGRTDIWALSSDPFVHHDYDIVVDRQNDGVNTGKYNVASDGKVTFHVGMGGDVNCDANVDFGDVLAIRNNWFYDFPVENEWASDVNCDGNVDFGDVLAVRNHWFYDFALNCCN